MADTVSISTLAFAVDTTALKQAENAMATAGSAADKLVDQSGKLARAGDTLKNSMTGQAAATTAAAQAANTLAGNGNLLTQAERNLAAQTGGLSTAGDALRTSLLGQTGAAQAAAMAADALRVQQQALGGAAASSSAAGEALRNSLLGQVAAAAAAAAAIDALRNRQQSLGGTTRDNNSMMNMLRSSLEGQAAITRAAAQAADTLRNSQQQLGGATERLSAGGLLMIERLTNMERQLGKTRFEIMRMEAAEMGVTTQAAPMIDRLEAASNATQKFTLRGAEARESMISLGRSMATGDMTQAGSSFINLASKMWEAHKMALLLGGGFVLLAAAAVGIGYLMGKGATEMHAMNNAMLVTSNYAGVTRASMENLAASMTRTKEVTINVANGIVTALVASGQIGANAITTIARLASDYAKATGQDIDKIAPKLVALFSDPVRGAEELDKQMHMLTVTQMEHIRTLDALGQKQEAQDALAQRLKDHIPAQAANVGTMAKAVNELAAAWHWAAQGIMDYGKVKTPETKAQALRDVRSEFKARGMTDKDQAMKDIEVQIDAAEKLEQAAKGEAKETAKATAAQIEHAGAWDLVRQKSSAYQLQQKTIARDRIALYKPEEGKDFDNQVRAKNDALRVADQELRDIMSSMGAKQRELIIQQINGAAALRDEDLKGREQALQTQHELGALTDRQFERSMNGYRLQEIESKKLVEEQMLGIAGLTDAEYAAHKAKIALYQKQMDNAEQAGVGKEDVMDRAKFQETIKAILDEGTAATMAGEAQNHAQELINAGIGKTVEQKAALAAAEQEHITLQMVSNALTIEDALNTTKMNDDARAILSMKLYFLQREIDLRRTGAGLKKEGDDKQTAVDYKKEQAAQAVSDWKDAAAEIGDALTSAFGNAGAAMKTMFDGWAANAEKQAAINKTLADSTRGIADPNDQRVLDARARAQVQTAQLQVKSYADMAGAAKSYFKEGTTGYKLLEGAEKAYRLFELALSASTLLTKMAATKAYTVAVVEGQLTQTAAATASVAPEVAASVAKGEAAAATGVANQATGDPYSAFFRMAAMAAAMAALGFAVSGGGAAPDIAAERDKVNGTGSVLGDPNAKSDSIARALAYVGANTSLELTHTAGMLRALQSIERNISNLGNIVARSTAPGATGALNVQSGKSTPLAAKAYGVIDGALGGAQIGSMFGPLGTIAGGLIGAAVGFIASKLVSTKVDVQDQGLQFGRQSVGDVSATGVNAQQYATVNTKKSFFGITYSNKTGDQTAQLGAEANQQFTAIVAQMAKGVTQAAKLLGVGGTEFTDHLNAFVLDIGKITTKGKTTDEIQKALETAFAKAGDDMARWSVTGLEQFQKAGEGYLETLVRVASDYANLDSILAATGMTFGATGIASLKAREDMIDLAGGIDQLASKADGFAQNFLSEEERLAPVTKYVNEEMGKLNLSLITTRKQFKELVLGLDLTVPANRELYVSLMDLQDAFAKTHVETEDLAKSEKDLAAERKGLQDQIDKLVMTSTQLRAKERATIDATNRNLFDQLAARQDIIAAYERESGALQTTIDRLKSFGATLSAFIGGLNQGPSSPLTPEQKNADAKKTYEELLAKAKGGDVTAQGQVTGAAQNYLTANRTINASSSEYTAVFNQVQKDMADLLKATGAQQTDAERQLAEMKTLTGSLVNLDTSVVSLTTAIQELRDALHAAPGGNEIESMYKNILGRDSDTAGLAFWTQDHANGASLQQIEHGITMSDEAQGKRAADIENLYKTLLGRASDAEGKAFWLDAYNHGHTLDSIAAEFKTSPEYKALHPDGSHALGLARVPFDGYMAELHAGEAVIDAPAMSALTRYFGNGGGAKGANNNANAALVAEIRALRAEVAALRADNERQSVRTDMATIKAAERNGDKVVQSTVDAARTAAWSALQLTKGIIK